MSGCCWKHAGQRMHTLSCVVSPAFTALLPLLPAQGFVAGGRSHDVVRSPRKRGSDSPNEANEADPLGALNGQACWEAGRLAGLEPRPTARSMPWPRHGQARGAQPGRGKALGARKACVGARGACFWAPPLPQSSSLRSFVRCGLSLSCASKRWGFVRSCIIL